MKVLIYTDVLSHKAGGLYYSVSSLAKSVLQNRCDVNLMGYVDEYFQDDMYMYGDVPLIKLKGQWPLKRQCLSFNTLKYMQDVSPTIIHQQGMWSFLSLYTSLYKKRNYQCKTVISPRGMLDPWIVKRSPLKKWIARRLFENENLKRANCIHALCESEYHSIRAYGLNNPIAIIPNGTNIPDWEREFPMFTKKTCRNILFLSRLHPKKGVLELVYAYAKIDRLNKNLTEKWHLKIGGWGDESYIEMIRKAIEENDLSDKVELLGAVYGKEKDLLLKNSDVFILPTYSEGLPMAVLEAWAYGLPVITTEYANLPEGFKAGAAYKISNDIDNLSERLIDFMQLPDDYIFSYGVKGLNLVKQQFSWDFIGQRTIQLYEWLLSGGRRPDFVYDLNDK